MDALRDDPAALKECIQTIIAFCHESSTAANKLKSAVANAARTVSWDASLLVNDPSDYSRNPPQVPEAYAFFRDLVNGSPTHAICSSPITVFPQLTNLDAVPKLLVDRKGHALELTRKILEPNIKELEKVAGRRALTAAPPKLMAVLDTWAPEASFGRTNPRESRAWRLRFSVDAISRGSSNNGLLASRLSAR